MPDESVFGPLTPAEQRELAYRLYHMQSENIPLGEKCWNIARELNTRLGVVRWNADKIRMLHDRDQWDGPPKIPVREDLKEVVLALSQDERTVDMFLHKLERAGLDAFVNLEALLMLVPEWLKTTNPVDWEPKDGLKAVKMIPEYLKAMASFVEDLDHLRSVLAKPIDGTAIPGLPSAERKMPADMTEESLGQLAKQFNQIHSLMKH